MSDGFPIAVADAADRRRRGDGGELHGLWWAGRRGDAREGVGRPATRGRRRRELARRRAGQLDHDDRPPASAAHDREKGKGEKTPKGDDAEAPHPRPLASRGLGHDEAGVGPAEAEGVGERGPDLAPARLVGDKVDAFDAVYGSSAGAINAAYFLGGRAGLGTTIYYEDINSPKFIDLARPLRGRPIVDLGFLLDEVAVRRKQLPFDRVLASRSPLTVVATDVDACEARALRSFATATDLVAALRASATMPVVAGGPRAFGGRRYLDASISEPIPVPPEPMAEDALGSKPLDDLNRDSPLKPVFFLLDSAELMGDAQSVLQQNAAVLKKYSSWQITIEGHCDAGAVKRAFGCAALRPVSFPISGVHLLPCQSVSSGGGVSVMSSHQTSPSGVKATFVKIVFFLIVSIAFGLDLYEVPGATPKKPASGLIA